MCNGGCVTGAVCMPRTGCTGGSTMTCMPDGNPCTSDPVDCDLATGSCLHPGRDEDGDGYAIARATGSGGTVTCPGGDDCDDSNDDVRPGAAEICNGIDDDCEGGIDEDGVCGTVPDTCASEQQIRLMSSGVPGSPMTGTASGSNRALADDYRPSCGSSGGRDAVYFVDLPLGTIGAVDVTLSTDHSSTTFDTVVAAQVGGTCGTFGRACGDDVSGSNQRSTVTFCVTPSATSATRIHVLVDGFDGRSGSMGDYTL